MSLIGLKKQFSKANQFVSEKIGGAKGTELDDDFVEMERRTDVIGKMVSDVFDRTQEYLQPNPTTRAKLWFSKLRGQGKSAAYPQPEGTLGDSMVKHGNAMGEESSFGVALVEAGEALKQMSDVKNGLEDTVKQNFLAPLRELKEKELKEVAFHLKKLSGRRLDYDCKCRKNSKTPASVSDEEIRVAEEKFEETKGLAESAMHNLLASDVEQIAQLVCFSESLLNYHRQCGDILQGLVETLTDRRERASQRPRSTHTPKRITSQRAEGSFRTTPSSSSSSSSLRSLESQPSASKSVQALRTAGHQLSAAAKPSARPHCKAIYDFDADNDGEISFHEGDIIYLLNRVDDNWLEGELNGRRGLLPTSYVNVVIDVSMSDPFD